MNEEKYFKQTAYSEGPIVTPNYSLKSNEVSGQSVYSKVMLWLMVAFAATAFGVWFVGPLVPVSMINLLWVVALIALIVSGFLRHIKILAPIMAIAIPLVLGIILYPTLNYYFATGAGNIVLSAAAGTALTFGVAAIMGWRSEKSLDSKIPLMTAVLFGLIGVSLLNVFIFKLAGLSFIISLITVPLFALYTYYDLNKLRRQPNLMSPASYALNIFLDIFNIFVSLLNIFGFTSRS